MNTRSLNSKNKGFVAIFTVTMLGFLAIMFTLTMLPRSWLEGQNVHEMRSSTEARFEAVSCAQFARQITFQNESEVGEYEQTEYFTQTGYCTIEDIRLTAGGFVVETSAVKNGIRTVVTTVLDRESLEIVSMQYGN